MKRFCTALIAVTLLLTVALSANAGSLSINPFIKVKQEYSDNILFSTNDEESDAITTLSGGLSLQQKTERLDAGLMAELDQLLYREFDDLNTRDYQYEGNITYRITEHLHSRATARYSEESRRDQDADTTGLILSGDLKRVSVSFGSKYLISELRNIDLSLDLIKSETDEVNETEDNDTIGVNLSYNQDLSEWFKNTVGIVNFNFLHYSVDLENTTDISPFNSIRLQDYISDIYQFSTGISHNISEQYNVFCLAGASFTQTSEKAVTRSTDQATGVVLNETKGPDHDDDTWGGVLSTGLKYKDIYYDIGFTLSQDMQGGTGTSGAVQRSSVSGSLIRKMTQDFSLTLNASWYLNKNERKASQDTEKLTLNIQPGFRYKLSRDFSLSGIYRFTSVEDREADTNSERNLVYLLLKKEFEL